MALRFHLGVDRLGDIVVPAPVGSPFGVGELVQEMPAGLVRQPLSLGIDLTGFLDETTTATL